MIGKACSGDLGVGNTPFLSQAIFAVLSSFELPKEASLEQT